MLHYETVAVGLAWLGSSLTDSKTVLESSRSVGVAKRRAYPGIASIQSETHNAAKRQSVTADSCFPLLIDFQA